MTSRDARLGSDPLQWLKEDAPLPHVSDSQDSEGAPQFDERPREAPGAALDTIFSSIAPGGTANTASEDTSCPNWSPLAVLRNMDLPLAIYDLQGSIVFANPAFESLCGPNSTQTPAPRIYETLRLDDGTRPPTPAELPASEEAALSRCIPLTGPHAGGVLPARFHRTGAEYAFVLLWPAPNADAPGEDDFHLQLDSLLPAFDDLRDAPTFDLLHDARERFMIAALVAESAFHARTFTPRDMQAALNACAHSVEQAHGLSSRSIQLDLECRHDPLQRAPALGLCFLFFVLLDGLAARIKRPATLTVGINATQGRPVLRVEDDSGLLPGKLKLDRKRREPLFPVATLISRLGGSLTLVERNVVTLIANLPAQEAAHGANQGAA